MGSNNSVQAKITAQSINNLTTSMSTTCAASFGGGTNNTSIVATNSNIRTLSVGSTCKVDSRCTIASSVQQAVSNKIGLSVDQDVKAITDLFNDGAFTKTLLQEDLTTNLINNTTQLMETTCQASSSQETNNTFIYLNNDSIKTLNVGATGSVSADCTMKNLCKMNSSTSTKIKASQRLKSEGMIAAIVIAVVSIVMIGGLIVLLLVSTGVLKGMTSGGGGGKNNFDASDELTKMEEEGLDGEGEAGLEGEGGALEGELAGGLEEAL